MLLESLRNSKEDMGARLLAEAKIEAKRNILALESAFKEDQELVDDEFIKSAKEQINILEKAIANDDSKKINSEAEELEEFAKTLAEIKMNQAIKRKPFPLPRIGETIQRLEKFVSVTALDLSHGYYSIPICKAS